MKKQENKPLTPSELLNYCQNILSAIPYTMAMEENVGKPIRTVYELLGKLKDVLAEAEQKEVKQNV